MEKLYMLITNVKPSRCAVSEDCHTEENYTSEIVVMALTAIFNQTSKNMSLNKPSLEHSHLSHFYASKSCGKCMKYPLILSHSTLLKSCISNPATTGCCSELLSVIAWALLALITNFSYFFCRFAVSNALKSFHVL